MLCLRKCKILCGKILMNTRIVTSALENETLRYLETWVSDYPCHVLK